jgi:hypothetical protein
VSFFLSGVLGNPVSDDSGPILLGRRSLALSFAASKIDRLLRGEAGCVSVLTEFLPVVWPIATSFRTRIAKLSWRFHAVEPWLFGHCLQCGRRSCALLLDALECNRPRRCSEVSAVEEPPSDPNLRTQWLDYPISNARRAFDAETRGV